MALGIVLVLRRLGRIIHDELAQVFAARYRARPWRGYGATAHEVLQAIGAGTPWSTASSHAFDGVGSMGNGAAMRVAPIGAYFAGDMHVVVEQAIASAQITHAHAEGKSGAIAVAVAAAWACTNRSDQSASGARLLDAVLEQMPDGETRRGLAVALELGFDMPARQAAHVLGNGSCVTAPDTVPFALWCAARHLNDFEEAMWTTVSGLGDRDTTCAIAGGIVALAAGRESMPAEWLQAREALEE
jgi:ADP-ribosylglycohydrolase